MSVLLGLFVALAATALSPDVVGTTDDDVLPDDGPWLTVIETAQRFRCSKKTILRHLAAGTFPLRAIKIGSMWRIDGSDLDRYLGVVEGRDEP